MVEVDKIKIGLVDSGLNNTNIIEKHIIQGYKSNFDSYHDYLGHGTSCAQIILSIFGNVLLYNVKVFDKKLITTTAKIIDAIEWCIKTKIKIINLSLSIQDLNYYYEFKQVCDKAYNQGIIIVASADNFGRTCLPAYLPNVIGVGVANVGCTEYFYSDNYFIQMYTNGLPPFNSNIDNTIHTTSYATARLTGIIASILTEQPDLDYHGVINILKTTAIAICEDKIIVKNLPFDFKTPTSPIILHSNPNLAKIDKKSITFIGFELETALFRNFSSLVKLDVQNMVELETEVHSCNFDRILESRQIPKYKLPDEYKDKIAISNTIILGDIPNYCYDIILKDVNFFKKNLISLYPIPKNIAEFDHNTMRVKFIHDKLKRIITKLTDVPSNHITNNQIPIIGIINLCEKQTFLNIELIIRQELIKSNCKIGQISSSTMGNMFGLDYTYSDYEYIPSNLHSAYGKALIESVNNKIPDADLVVVGLDTPVVPLNFISHNFFDKYTTSNIAMLFGFQVDAFVLVINELNEVEYILSNINCLKSLLKAEVMLIIYNSLSNQTSISNGNQNAPIYDRVLKIAQDRFYKIKNEMGKRLGLIVYDIKDEEQRKQIIEKIIDIYR